MIYVVNTGLLWAAFRHGQVCEIKGIIGIISSIEREDGSGLSFNIKIRVDRDMRNVYIRFSE